MKNSKNIINHLLNNPLYSKIVQVKCFNRLKSLLPPRLQKGIVFIYKKEKTLFLVLNHPTFKMEFNYKLDLIKLWLKQLQNIDDNCKGLDIETVKTFVSNKVVEKKESKNVDLYEEKSDGDFENLAKDKNIKEVFDKIKMIIRDNINE